MEHQQTDTNTPKSSEESSEYLSFVVGGDAYAIAIAAVREIRGWTEPANMPDSNSFSMGVINLRGEILPLMDLAAKLGLKTPEINERSVIIVVEYSGETLGFLVDSVSNIIAPEADDLTPPPENVRGRDTSFVSAITLVNEELVRILSLDAVVLNNVANAA